MGWRLNGVNSWGDLVIRVAVVAVMIGFFLLLGLVVLTGGPPRGPDPGLVP